MKRTLIAALAAAGATAACAASAEEPVIVTPGPGLHFHLAASEAAREQADVWKKWADDFSREMRASMGTMFAPRALSSRVVKGAP